MKKQLLVATGLMVLAAPAFATKARLEALGEDNYGSYYVNDNRNMFLNPARINDHKDVVNYEFGASGTGAGAAADTAQQPKAEGGFTKGHGNMVYGVQFGNTTPNVGLVRALAGNTVSERQPWDLFVGGDAGIKWGANVTYENYDSGRTGSTSRVASNSLRTRLGVVLGDLDVFAHISLANSAKDFRNGGQGSSVKGNVGYLLGAAYTLNNYRLIAEWRQIGAKYQNPTTTGGAKRDFDYNQIRIGAARQERLNDKATLFVKALIVRQDASDKGNALGATADTAGYGQGNTWSGAGKATSLTLPVTLGTEYNATSWLDFRASVSQNVYSSAMTDPRGTASNQKKAYGSVANTAVRAGASLKFGDFSIDGLISTNNDQLGTGDTTTSSGKGNLRTDQLMSRVSMIYRF